jgi:hypothetical protein
MCNGQGAALDPVDGVRHLVRVDGPALLGVAVHLVGVVGDAVPAQPARDSSAGTSPTCPALTRAAFGLVRTAGPACEPWMASSG